MEANRRLTAVAARPIRFADWLFGPRAAGIDLQLMCFVTGWAMLETFHPKVFSNGALIGLAWLPNRAWLAFHLALALLHAVGLTHLHWRWFRVATAFTSAWQWLVVAISIARVDITPSVVAYGILGVYALLGGMYLAGLPSHKEA